MFFYVYFGFSIGKYSFCNIEGSVFYDFFFWWVNVLMKNVLLKFILNFFKSILFCIKNMNEIYGV